MMNLVRNFTNFGDKRTKVMFTFNFLLKEKIEHLPDSDTYFGLKMRLTCVRPCQYKYIHGWTHELTTLQHLYFAHYFPPKIWEKMKIRRRRSFFAGEEVKKAKCAFFANSPAKKLLRRRISKSFIIFLNSQINSYFYRESVRKTKSFIFDGGLKGLAIPSSIF